MIDTPRPAASRRSVGAKAGIDRGQIVAAALTIVDRPITMQAVARILGVDRSAVNHHVASREQLLQLVADTTFAREIGDIDIRAGLGWQEAAREYVRGYAEALISTGALAEHLSAALQEDRFLRSTEALLDELLSADFSDEHATRFVVTLGYIAQGWARDRIAIDAGAATRRADHTRAALAERDPAEFPHLDRVSAARVDTYGSQQLTYALDAAIEGAQARIAGDGFR
ncbi:MAG: hypothetical protein P0Y60_12840 [Candidatus Microbacterium colombiense]|nr:MAG: hypothetical protein P0Y60_12840 [Microbacterium sp.]